tara:strand:- start:129 stop:473 length:345 start_codon:yes stop_codon:yes gene_type:complete
MESLKDNILLEVEQGNYKTLIAKDKYNFVVSTLPKMNKEGRENTTKDLLAKDKKDYYTSIEALFYDVYRKRVRLRLNKLDMVTIQKVSNQAYQDILELAHGISEINHVITRNEE